jgi:hypothetical protein
LPSTKAFRWSKRRQRLERLLAGAEIPRLRLVEAFDDGEEPLKASLTRTPPRAPTMRETA